MFRFGKGTANPCPHPRYFAFKCAQVIENKGDGENPGTKCAQPYGKKEVNGFFRADEGVAGCRKAYRRRRAKHSHIVSLEVRGRQGKSEGGRPRRKTAKGNPETRVPKTGTRGTRRAEARHYIKKNQAKTRVPKTGPRGRGRRREEKRREEKRREEKRREEKSKADSSGRNDPRNDIEEGCG